MTLTFLLGLTLGRYFLPVKQKALFLKDEKAQSLKEGLLKLHAEDIKSYQLLEDAQEKYQKANEILGKVMLIFLANLGVEYTSQEQAVARKLIENEGVILGPSNKANGKAKRSDAPDEAESFDTIKEEGIRQ